MSGKKRQPKPSTKKSSTTEPQSAKSTEASSPPSTEPQETPANEPSELGLAIPRVVSVVVLLVVLLLFGSLFFEVMRGFISPLFLAGVLAVIFEPLHKWFLAKMPEKQYLAAAATTSAIVLLVFLPLTWLTFQAAAEIPDLVAQFQSDDGNQPSILETTSDARENIEKFVAAQFGVEVDLGKYLSQFVGQARGFLLDYGVNTLLAVVGLTVGVTIMAFALYYFLADGPVMIEALMRLSPLDDEYERELLEKFAEVSRAVVVATLLSAVAQGLLAGVGYYFALPSDAPIFLLTIVTMMMAIVPFLGAMAVWAPVALAIVCLRGEPGPDGEFLHTGFWPGIILAVYGFTIVSTVDNFIKPWVLHGQSNLHPLLALLSVLGGVSALGPIGILVGPMLVAFLQALLDMLRKELDHLNNPSAGKEQATPAAGR